MQKFILYINEESDKYLQEEDISCYLLESTLSEKFIRDFINKAGKLEKIVLLIGGLAVKKQKEFQADGIVIDLSKSANVASDYKKIVQGSPKDIIIGVISRTRRHEAMLISECEPDFLIFNVWKDGDEHAREIISWYNELFLIQSALFCREEGIEIEKYQTDIAIINEKMYKILIAKKRKLD